MKRLQLYYPVRPHAVNRPWGYEDPVYEQFGFTQHNGVDLDLVPGQKIHAPIGGSVVNAGDQPEGSGIFVSIISDDQYLFDDGISAYVLIEFFHCEKILVNIGDGVTIGQLIARGDTTGRATGPHTHMQPRRVTMTKVPDASTPHAYRIHDASCVLADLDTNDANNTFDPEPYWNQRYASAGN